MSALALVLLGLTAALAGPAAMDRVQAAKAETPAPLPEATHSAALSALCADLVRMAPQGRVPADGARRAEQLGYALERDGDRLWLTDIQQRGAGVLGLRLGPLPTEIVLQAPHPFFDRKTGVLASQLFDEQPVRAVVLATAQRYSTPEADAAHEPFHPVNTITDGLVRGSPEPMVVQLHGFAVRPNRPDDVYLSSGRSWWSEADLAAIRRALSAHLGGRSVAFGSEENGLAGQTNTQARTLIGRTPVLLLELSPALRSALVGDGTQRGALWDALEEGSRALKTPALPRPRWSLPVPLAAEVAETGLVALPPSTALRIRLAPEAPVPRITDAFGRPVSVVGLEDSLLVPAQPWVRALDFDVEDPTTVTLWFQSRRGQSVRWDRWEQGAFQAIADGTDVPPPVPGAEPVLRDLEARREAGMGAAIQALGLLHDLALTRPVSLGAFGPPEVVASTSHGGLEASVTGPARVRLEVSWDQLDRVNAGTLQWALDGGPPEQKAVRSTAGSARGHTLFIPPGEHTLRTRFDGDAATFTLLRRNLRRSATWPDFAVTPQSPIEAAELDYLLGQRSAAREAFDALDEGEGPTVAFARARRLQLSREGDLDVPTMAPPSPAGPATQQLYTAALLARGPDLSPAQVRAALEQLPTGRHEDLALWLDANSLDRPFGVGLWASQFPMTPALRSASQRLVSHYGAHTTLRSLQPEVPGQTTYRKTPPGIPRALLAAGDTSSVEVPPGPADRLPVLRLQCATPCEFSVRDPSGNAQPFVGAAGRYDVAVPPGVAQLSVRRGDLMVLDPELLPDPALTYESTGAMLPATWSLPGDDVPVDLRPEVQPGGRIDRAIFDDGTVRAVTARGLVAPPGARTVRLEGSGVASLAMRTGRDAQRARDVTPPDCAAASLDAIEDASRALLAGDNTARLTLAEMLGCRGLPGMARVQLSAARRLSALPPNELLRIDRWLLTTLPDAPAPGPVGRLGATAAVGAPETDDPQTLSTLAGQNPAQAAPLWREAALAWEARSLDPATSRADAEHAWIRSVDAALRAGDAGETVRARLLGRIDWSDLTVAESSAGVDAAVLDLPADPGRTPSARARRALWAWPWPAESALRLRNDGAATIRLPAHAKARLRIACRDDRDTIEPCHLDMETDGEAAAVVVPVGAPIDVTLDGADTVELHGPGAGRTASILLEVDGRALAPTTERQVLRVRAGQPAAFVVAAPVALRVTAIDPEPVEVQVFALGSDPETAHAAYTVSPGQPDVSNPTPDLLLDDVAGGPYRVEVSGSGRIRVRTGSWRPSRTPEGDEGVPEESLLPAQSPVDLTALVREVGAATRAPEAWGALPGAGPTWEIAGAAGRDQVWNPQEPWPVLELSADRLRRQDRLWTQAGGWVHGPTAAGGLRVEVGRRSDTGWLGGRGTAQLTRDIANQGVSSAGLALFGTRDRPLSSETKLRFEGRADGRLQSGPPIVVADPMVWSVYRADHPLYLDGAAGVLHAWNRESRVGLRLRARTNTGPSLDRIGAELRGDRLIGFRTQLSGQIATDLRFADEHRARTNLNPRLRGDLQRVLRATPDQHLRAWTRATWQPLTGGLELWIGLRFLDTDGRGLRDLAPYRELFRTQLEGA